VELGQTDKIIGTSEAIWKYSTSMDVPDFGKKPEIYSLKFARVYRFMNFFIYVVDMDLVAANRRR
jgi:hypothetical protein